MTRIEAVMQQHTAKVKQASQGKCVTLFNFNLNFIVPEGKFMFQPNAHAHEIYKTSTATNYYFHY